MKRVLVAGLVVALWLLMLMVPKAYAPIIPHEYTLDIPCFAPTKITFNYAYTHNHSISDISTFGSGLYRHSGGPNFYEFIAQDVDDYHFSLTLTYGMPTNQTILIGMWSGTMEMMGFNLHSFYEYLVIHVRLRLTPEPTYPSESEVAQAVVVQVSRDLEDYYSAMTTLTEQQNQTIMTTSILAVVAVVISLVMSILHIYELRRMRWGQRP